MARVPTIRGRRTLTQAPPQIDPRSIQSPFSQALESAVAIRDAIDSGLRDEGAEAGAKAVARDENGNLVVEQPGILGHLLPQWAAARQNAAEAAYLASADSDVREQLNELRKTHQLDAAAFNQEAEKLAVQFRDQAPTEFSAGVFRMAQAEATRVSRGIAAAAERVERQRQRSSLLGEADRLRDDMINIAAQGGTETEDFAETSAKLNGVLDILTANPLLGFTEEDARTFREETRQDAQMQAIAGVGLAVFERTGSASKAVQQIERAVDQAGLGEIESRKALKFAVAKVVDRGRIVEMAEAESRAAAERGRAIRQSNLEIAVSRGEAGQEEIEKAFRDGIIAPNERTRLTLRADKAHAARIEAETNISRVGAALTGQELLNPRDKKDRDAVEAFWQRALETTLNNAAPVVRDNAMVRLASRTGVIPESERGRVAGALMAGSVDDKVRAADTLDRFGDANPILLDQFSARERQVGQMIAAFTNAGMEPALSVEAAEKAVFEAKDPERQARRKEMKDEDLLSANQKWLATELDNLTLSLGEVLEGAAGLFLFNEARVPEVTPSALADFNLIFQNHFEATGDAKTARKLTFQDFRRTWGVTEIGPRRTMKYAPEVVYQDDVGWVEEQFKEEVESLGLKSRDVILVSDDRTAREANGQPSYGLLHRDEDGRLVPVRQDGTVLRFRPDLENAPAMKRQRKQAGERVEAAQRSREASAAIERLRRRSRPAPDREEILMEEIE